MNNYMWLLFIGTFFSAFSQLLLKQSANKTYKNPIFEYLNWRVILSYGIFAAVLFLNTYAYTKVDMKYGAVIDTFTYVFVMVLSYFILKEKFTKEKLIGNLIPCRFNLLKKKPIMRCINIRNGFIETEYKRVEQIVDLAKCSTLLKFLPVEVIKNCFNNIFFIRL